MNIKKKVAEAQTPQQFPNVVVTENPKLPYDFGLGQIGDHRGNSNIIKNLVILNRHLVSQRYCLLGRM
jgi:hypothetical protein